MFYEIAQKFSSPFRPFSLYPSADNRSAWASLNEEWKQKTIALGETYFHFVFPCLSAADFMDFSKTGNRIRYEEKYFSKRLALDALVLAECVEDRGRFLPDIINGIFSICEESAWQLPAHNTYKRDDVQLPLPDHAAPVLDLFACESGAVLSAVFYLLKSRLDAVSPFITKRILSELHRRIFTPYLNFHFWWMGNGAEPVNNWTIWCTQNVLLCTYLTTAADETMKDRVFRKAVRSIDYFLAEYGEDGCCDEGAQYYRHAGLCLFHTIELLNHITDNLFLELYQNNKIKNMASYILNVHVDDKYYINFADCSPIAGRCGTREFLFALKTENKNMAAFAASDFNAGKPDTLLMPTENNLYYRLLNAFTIKEIKDFPVCDIFHPDIYYPSVGIFIARDSSFVLAVKAGDNADSHNHNDCGSITVYKNGAPFLIDIGVESYTRKTFSPQRYEIWTMQSAYHNLPTVNGFLQRDGEAFRAEDIAFCLTDSLCSIRMDLSAAYPKEAGLLHYYREVSLVKEKEIRLTDRITFDSDVTLPCKKPVVQFSFMTYEKPVLHMQAGALCYQIGSLGKILICGAEADTIETIPITDTRLKTTWKHDVYRILVTGTEKEIKIRIS